MHKCVVRVGVRSTLPSVVGKFISRPTETGPELSGQTVRNARNSNFLSSNCGVPNLRTRTMATKATSFPALVHRTYSRFEDRLHSRILQFLRTLVLLVSCCARWLSLWRDFYSLVLPSKHHREGDLRVCTQGCRGVRTVLLA